MPFFFVWFDIQSEEDRLEMERRIQHAEERMSSSGRRDSEADELRRELEEARMAERMAKMQLQEARRPQSPVMNSSAATNALSAMASFYIKYNY